MDRDLERLIEEAVKHTMTPEEIFEQKVSWVYGQLMDCNPEITKEQVRAKLKKKLGVP